MKLYSFSQVDTLPAKKYDVFISSTGYESRSSFLAEKAIDAEKKIVLAFLDNKEHPNRLRNDSIFKELNFEFVDIKGSDSQVILDLLDSIVSHHPSNQISILIDYSSMTRVWYSAILYYISKKLNVDKKIKVYFSYSVSEFVAPPKQETETLNFYPIDFFCHLSLPTKPTALIAGLGYEKKRVFGLREYFDAEALYLFYTDGNSFTEDVLRKNQEVIGSVKTNHIFPYVLSDMVYTKMLLQDLCEALKDEYRVIIAPCGPKPFTLLSFIVASNMSNIDVWRISARDDEELISDKGARGDLVIVELVYESDKFVF